MGGSLPRLLGPERAEAPGFGCKAQFIVGGAAIQMNTLPRPPEVDDGRHAQGAKGTALASELPRPPEAVGGHAFADGDGLLAAGLPRPPEAADLHVRALRHFPADDWHERLFGDWAGEGSSAFSSW